MASENKAALGDIRSTRVKQFGDSVWAEFADLVSKYKPINLGQGFPNYPAPEFCKDAACEAVRKDYNQYARTQGHGRLCKALSDTFTPLLHRKTPICHETEVMVSVGACESLFLAMQAFVNPGDEVILIEPNFDFYEAQIKLVGGIIRSIPLRNKSVGKSGVEKSAADFYLDWEEFESILSDKTKLCIVNTPHNPTGKVFSREELMKIAEYAKKYNFLVLSDEVYEWMVFDDHEHVRMATLPGMWERTITIGSAGKTFGVTGWKIGWTIGSASLIKAMWTVHQYVAYTVTTPLQEAVAVSFETALKNGFFDSSRKLLQEKRDALAAKLRAESCLEPIIPHGTYFMMVDTSRLTLPEGEHVDGPRDFAVAKYITKKYGVLGIPPSAFYSGENKKLADNLLRLCFCKTDDMLTAAGKKLSEIK